MDDLLELFDEEEKLSTTPSPPQKATSRSKVANDRHIVSDETRLAASVDDRVGIRMLNRSISGVDLLSLITSTEYLYVSCAQMAASSLSTRNSSWLLQPATVVDAATVTGKTRICTVGIVFSNSGTRVSSNQGKAFCAITLGNLATGPSVTVLLFGPAYSKWSRSLKPGKVVLLLQPNLIPPSTNNNNNKSTQTAITVVINSDSQLRMVGDAQDFAVCKAMTRGKNERGQWVDNAHQCRNFVDTRISEFCSCHQPNKNKSNVAKRGLSQIRNDATIAKVLTMPNRNIAESQSHLTTVPSRNLPQHRFEGSSVSTILSQLDSNASSKFISKNKNALLNPTNKVAGAQSKLSTSTRGPLRSSQSPSANAQSRSLPSFLQNPYGKTVSKITNSSNVPLAGANRPLVQPSQNIHPSLSSSKRSTNTQTDDFLQVSKPKKNVQRGRRVTIVNTDTVGFDGSVPVPKPSVLFTRNSVLHNTTVARSKLSNARLEPQVPTPQILVERQQLLSQKLQESRAVPTVKRRRQQQNHPGHTANENTSSREALLFESLRDVDLETTAAAQSHFASEADAEEFARSRRVVTELEQQEEKKEKNTKANTKACPSSSSSAIQKEWYCQNCKRAFSNKPNMCITKNHIIKVKRQLRTERSTEETRLELTNKSAEDGGLKLGSGLEWSRWNRSI